MTIKSLLRLAATSTLLFVCAGIAAAQGPVADADTTTSELTMNATVQTSVQLNISTGSGGSTVSGSDATGLYSVEFGNINGLGTGTPSAGVTKAIDASGTLYTTPINLTPVFSGFVGGATAVIEVAQDPAGDTDMAREGGAANSTATVSTGASTFAVGGIASGVPTQRFVGMYAARSEVAGAKQATLIYTVTVALD